MGAFRRPYALVALTWLASRAVAVALVPLLAYILNDVDIYQGWVPILRGGAFPQGDATWQYPPGAGLLIVLPDFAPGPFLPAFVAFMLLVDLAILAMLLIAHRRRPDRADLGLWLWASAGVLCGPLLVTRFDLLPTFFAVAALLLLARPFLSGATAALGFLVKVWPALLLLALPRARTMKAAVAFLLMTVTVLAGLTMVLDGTLSFLGNQASRGLQAESTGAMPYWLAALAGRTIDYGLEYGAMQVRMAGTEIAGTALTIVGILVLAVLAWWRLRGRLESVAGADVALTAVMVSVATSRVYSPQFNVWLIGLAAVATISTATRMRTVALILVGVSISTEIVYPFFYTQFTDGEAWMILVQAGRITGLLVAVVLALNALAQAGRSAQSATADAAATLSESTPPDMGTRTTTSEA